MQSERERGRAGGGESRRHPCGVTGRTARRRSEGEKEREVSEERRGKQKRGGAGMKQEGRGKGEEWEEEVERVILLWRCSEQQGGAVKKERMRREE